MSCVETEDSVESGIRVLCKRLVWTADDLPSAECVFGHYVIHPWYRHVELLNGYGRSLSISLGRIELGREATVDDLKDAAQRDFETRIAAALVVADSSGVPAATDALEAIAELPPVSDQAVMRGRRETVEAIEVLLGSETRLRTEPLPTRVALRNAVLVQAASVVDDHATQWGLAYKTMTDQIAQAVLALRASPPPAPELPVKQLEWRKDMHWGTLDANTPIGVYSVRGEEPYLTLWRDERRQGDLPGGVSTTYATEDLAKAAAQEMHDARARDVLAALLCDGKEAGSDA